MTLRKSAEPWKGGDKSNTKIQLVEGSNHMFKGYLLPVNVIKYNISITFAIFAYYIFTYPRYEMIFEYTLNELV